MKDNIFRVLASMLVAVTLFGTLIGQALADDAYRFEMIVFERPGSASAELLTAADATEPLPTAPALATRAVGERRLGNIAYTLKKQGMQVHEHIAWVQTPGARNSETWYSIGDSRLNGNVRVTRGRFLHIDADLVLIDAPGSAPIRAHLYRRMRSDELHYIDHPRIGIVIRADRVETQEPSQGTDATAGEPRPAQPAGT